MKRKRLLSTIISFYTVFVLSLTVWTQQAWSASHPVVSSVVEGAFTEVQPSPSPDAVALSSYPYIPANAQVAKIFAQEYTLYNPESGKVILQSKDQQPVPIASTTKLMTTYITAKQGSLDDVTTISAAAAGQIGSLMNIHQGEKIKVRNLLYGALLVSGNDAVYALAEYMGGKLLNQPEASSDKKIARFVEEMNKQASSLYMTDTRYKDPAGLNDEGHSTSTDLAKIGSVDIANPVLRPIMGTADITVYDQSGYYRYDLHNSNRLLEDSPYDGIMGGKTGFTPDAGHCLVTTAKRGNLTLTAVILHTDLDTADASANEARRLLDLGFSLTQLK